jgi:hypothetical protein
MIPLRHMYAQCLLFSLRDVQQYVYFLNFYVQQFVYFLTSIYFPSCTQKPERNPHNMRQDGSALGFLPFVVWL